MEKEEETIHEKIVGSNSFTNKKLTTNNLLLFYYIYDKWYISMINDTWQEERDKTQKKSIDMRL